MIGGALGVRVAGTFRHLNRSSGRNGSPTHSRRPGLHPRTDLGGAPILEMSGDDASDLSGGPPKEPDDATRDGRREVDVPVYRNCGEEEPSNVVGYVHAALLGVDAVARVLSK